MSLVGALDGTSLQSSGYGDLLQRMGCQYKAEVSERRPLTYRDYSADENEGITFALERPVGKPSP